MIKINYVVVENDTDCDNYDINVVKDIEGNDVRFVHINDVGFVSARDLYKGSHIKESYDEVLAGVLSSYDECKKDPEMKRKLEERPLCKKINGEDYLSLAAIFEFGSYVDSDSEYGSMYLGWLSIFLSGMRI